MYFLALALILGCGSCAPYLSDYPQKWQEPVEATAPIRPVDAATGLNLSLRDPAGSWERVDFRNDLTGAVKIFWLQSPHFFPAEDPIVIDPWPPPERKGYLTVDCDGRVAFRASVMPQIPTEEEWAAHFHRQGLRWNTTGQIRERQRILMRILDGPLLLILPTVEASFGTEAIPLMEEGVLFHSEDGSCIDENRFLGVRVRSEEGGEEAIYRIRLTNQDREDLVSLNTEHCQ